MADFQEVLSLVQEAKERVSPEVKGTLESTSLAQAEAIYEAVREVRPKIVVETGTSNGVFAATIAAALDENDKGHLTTIDLAYREGGDIGEHRRLTFDAFKGACIPDGERSGWLVPKRWNSRVHRRTGKTQTVLPKVVTEMVPGSPELFVFDSGHDAGTQALEIEIAVHHGVAGAPVFMDDVGWSPALDLCSDIHGLTTESIPDGGVRFTVPSFLPEETTSQ